VSARLRVGIAGARGIGRHQAKWFAQVGCEVASLYGTTSASANAAAAELGKLIDFRGRVEWDWDRFVEAPDLDAISVCSPPGAHAANTVSALRAGKHVLCEKPLVWDWEMEAAGMLESAREMVAAAAGAGRVLAVNAQYPAAVPPLLQLYRRAHQREPGLRKLAFHMETAGAPRSAHGPAEVWADLGPHSLAVVDRLLPGGAPDVGSARRERHDTDVVMHVDWLCSRGRVPVTFELRRIKEKAAVRREFVLDGWTVAYQARNVGSEFRAALCAPPDEWVGEDFMRASVRSFAEAALAGDPALVLLSGEDALRQFEFQLALWERCFP
jgi:predicted dehydrogenase